MRGARVGQTTCKSVEAVIDGWDDVIVHVQERYWNRFPLRSCPFVKERDVVFVRKRS
jgi:hypothetical protein